MQIARPSARPATDAGATQGAVTSMLGVSEVDRTRYYREWDSLRGALAGGDTVLIRGSWFACGGGRGGQGHSEEVRRGVRCADLPT